VTRIGQALVVPWSAGHFTLPVGPDLSGEVRRFLGRNEFDVVHCHGLFPPEIAFWAIVHARAPVVTTYHSSFVASPAFRPALRTLLSGVNRRIAARIAVSAASRDWASGLFPGDYDIIHNGVDLERFRPGAPPPPSFADGRPTVLYVGRLDRRKGLPVLLRAMADVLRRAPDARLVVAGPGPLERRCRRICDQLGITGSVAFVGPVPPDELPGYYANCTVYVSPTINRESMGIVLIEAMACGRAVVASDIPGYDEVVQSGRNGLLVPRDDAPALASAITAVLRDNALRDRLETGALARAHDFAWPLIAGRIETVYRRVLRGGAA